ncbi:hypothetical protein N9V43_01050 [Flavobacteriales bacterium]|nr:hypothetical protein [Flavobacteriales bacterium]
MKNLLQTTALLCIYLFSFNAIAQPPQYTNAPDLTFTDLDSVTHTIHEYTYAGYKVILDFSYEQCNPCKDWALNVGHDLWDTHGPDGDNTIRMFHIDPMAVTDQEVASYTQSWGVEYPVINVQSLFDEYPLDGYPRVFFICSDRTYYEDGGYGYPFSQLYAQHYLEACNGSDLDGNKVFISVTPPLASTICNINPLTYAPEVNVFNNDFITIGDTTALFNQPYNVEIYINDEYHTTQVVDPTSNIYYVNNIGDQSVLSPIEVSTNDELTFVIDVEGDNFPDDDTLSITVPSQLNTPLSSTTQLQLMPGSSDVIDLKNSNGDLIDIGNPQNGFTLTSDSCYSIKFFNAHYTSGGLKDANGTILVTYQAGQYDGYQTPFLYFHVSDSLVAVEEQQYKSKISSIVCYDILGKQYQINDLSSIPKGIYFELKTFTNGRSEITKMHK